MTFIGTATVKTCAIVGAIIGFLFGDWQQYLSILIVMQSIDLVTGMMNTKRKYELSSRLMYKRIMKKFAVWLVVIMAHMIDLILFEVMCYRQQ